MVKLARKGLRLSRRGKRTSNVYRKTVRRMKTNRKLGNLMKYGVYKNRNLLRRRRMTKRKRYGTYKPKVYKRMNKKKSYGRYKLKYNKIKRVVNPKDYNSSSKFVIGSQYINDRSYVEALYNTKSFKMSDFVFNDNNMSSQIIRQLLIEVPKEIFKDKKLAKTFDDDAVDLRLLQHYTKYSLSKPGYTSNEDDYAGFIMSLFKPFNLTTINSALVSKILSVNPSNILNLMKLLFATVDGYIVLGDAGTNSFNIIQFNMAQLLTGDVNTAVPAYVAAMRLLVDQYKTYGSIADLLNIVFDKKASRSTVLVFRPNVAYIPAANGNAAVGSPFIASRVDLERFLYDEFGSLKHTIDFSAAAILDLKGFILTGSDIVANAAAWYPGLVADTALNFATRSNIIFEGTYLSDVDDSLEFQRGINPYLAFVISTNYTFISRLKNIRQLTRFLNDVQSDAWVNFISAFLTGSFVSGHLANYRNWDDAMKTRAFIHTYYLMYFKRTGAIVYNFQELEVLLNQKLLSIKPIKYNHNYIYKPRTDPNLHLFVSAQYLNVTIKQELSIDLRPLKSFLRTYNSDSNAHNNYPLTEPALALFNRLKLLGVSQREAANNINRIKI